MKAPFHFSVYDSTLKTVPVNLDDNHEIRNWLKFYAKHRSISQDDSLPRPEIVQQVLVSNLVPPSTLYETRDGTITKAIGRLTHAPDSVISYLTDLYYSKMFSGMIFIDSLLEEVRARENEKLICWIPERATKTMELLSNFAFEARRVHLMLRNIILETPKHPDNIPAFIESDSTLIPVNRNRFPCITLNELMYHTQLKWIELKHSSHERENNLRSYQSTSSPHMGVIQYDDYRLDEKGGFLDSLNICISTLYSRGVREITCEVDVEQKIKQLFLNAGFGIDYSLFQMELDLVK